MNAASKGSSIRNRARAKVVDIFGADLRSLALFRIVLALLVLADLINRATDLSAHYTDDGVLPRSVLVEEVLNPLRFSLSLMNGEPFFQALLFVVAALAALGLLVGYRTRTMTAIVWVLVLSIQWRNPLLSNGGDVLLRLLLFWGMFLPLGAYWSVDRVLRGGAPRLSMRYLSMATVALFLQIAFMYWFTALLKSGPEWREDGTALYYALSIDRFATPIGNYLLQFPELLKLLTFGTIALEAFGPFLLFFPFLTGLVRTGAVMAFMSLHFGIWLTMDVGIFPWVSAFCMVCFLPTWFWSEAAKMRPMLPVQRVFGRLQGAVARHTHAYWSALRMRLSSLATAGQSAVVGAAADGADGQPGSRAVGMTAIPTVKKTWRGEVRPAGQVVADGEKSSGDAAGPEPPMLRSSLANNLLAAFFLLYVFCWNLGNVSDFSVPDRASSLGYFLGLDQSWSMFSPYPPRTGGWYVIPGTLRNGEQVDLLPVTRDDFYPHEVSWKKPESVLGIYKNQNWSKYLSNILMEEEFVDQRRYFGGYLCREWNARYTGGQQLITFQITYMLEETLPDYQQSKPQKVILEQYRCD